MPAREEKPLAVAVIPTYNEAGSIGPLLDELRAAAGAAGGWRFSALVVDDSSPDGTADAVRRKTGFGGDVFLLSRPKKEGIGAAYCAGFKYAMNELHADAVVEFDGDGQHPADCVPALLRELDAGADYAVASRNIKGGSEPAGRGFARLALTLLGGLAARFILFFPTKRFLEVTDPTTGLKATRVRGFADRLALDSDKLVSRDFGYKVQWLAEILRLGARYKEVPLRFENRRAGKSKFTPGAIIDVLRACVLVRAADPWARRFFKFALVGLTGYLVNAIFLAAIFRVTGMEVLSWLLSTEIAILSNYVFNNAWTFSGEGKTGARPWLAGLLKFNAASLGSLAILGILGPFLTMLIGGAYRQIILAGIIVFLVVPYNWFTYNKFVWRTKRPQSHE